MAQSQPALAISEATAAVKSDPSSVSASYILATILDQTGETTKAAAESERGLGLDQSNGECHFQLGVSLAKQGQLMRAMSEAQRALDLIPENAHAHDLLLALDRQLRRDDDMLAAARDAIAVSPFDADLHYRAGLAAGQAGDFAMAANQFAYAFLLDPTTPEPGQKLRIALSFVQQRSDATNTIRDLKSLAAGSPKLLEILAAYEQSPNSNP
jgi:Flp pilus assembly protein TadD